MDFDNNTKIVLRLSRLLNSADKLEKEGDYNSIFDAYTYIRNELNKLILQIINNKKLTKEEEILLHFAKKMTMIRKKDKQMYD